MKNLKELQQNYAESNSAKDQRAFYEEVYERYFNRVYCFLLGRNQKYAEDIAADVFERLLKLDPSTLQLATIESFIFSIAKNLATDYHRRYNQRAAISITSDLDNFIGLSVDPKTRKEFMMDFETALTKLSARQHQAIALQLTGYSQADIAKQLLTTKAAIRSLLQHSRKKLRMQLSNWRQ